MGEKNYSFRFKASKAIKLRVLVGGVLGEACIRGLKPRTVTRMLSSVTRAMSRRGGGNGDDVGVDGDGGSEPLRLPTSILNGVIDNATKSIQELFDAGSVIVKLR